MNGEEEIDALDACIFSGDLLYTNLVLLKEHLARWQRAIEAHQVEEV